LRCQQHNRYAPWCSRCWQSLPLATTGGGAIQLATRLTPSPPRTHFCAKPSAHLTAAYLSTATYKSCRGRQHGRVGCFGRTHVCACMSQLSLVLLADPTHLPNALGWPLSHYNEHGRPPPGQSISMYGCCCVMNNQQHPKGMWLLDMLYLKLLAG
jgi:hypothetical protein